MIRQSHIVVFAVTFVIGSVLFFMVRGAPNPDAIRRGDPGEVSPGSVARPAPAPRAVETVGSEGDGPAVDEIAARVGDSSISVAELEGHLERAGEGRDPHLRAAVLEKLIEARLLDRYLEERRGEWDPAAAESAARAELARRFGKRESIGRACAVLGSSEAEMLEMFRRNAAVDQLLRDRLEPVSENDVREAYASHAEAFQQARRRLVSAFFIPADALGTVPEEVLMQLRAGRRPDTIAKRRGLEDHYRVLEVPDGDESELGVLVWGKRVGQTFGPVTIGRHRVSGLVVGEKEGSQRSFSEVAPSLRQRLERDRSRKARSDLLTELRRATPVEIRTLEPSSRVKPGASAEK